VTSRRSLELFSDASSRLTIAVDGDDERDYLIIVVVIVVVGGGGGDGSGCRQGRRELVVEVEVEVDVEVGGADEVGKNKVDSDLGNRFQRGPRGEVRAKTRRPQPQKSSMSTSTPLQSM
jgi:hypothetical protein